MRHLVNNYIVLECSVAAGLDSLLDTVGGERWNKTYRCQIEQEHPCEVAVRCGLKQCDRQKLTHLTRLTTEERKAAVSGLYMSGNDGATYSPGVAKLALLTPDASCTEMLTGSFPLPPFLKLLDWKLKASSVNP